MGRALWWCALFAVCFLSAIYAFPYLRSRGGAGASGESVSRPAVLSLWHTDTFEGGRGSRAAFLKRVAAEYGKKNGGVIVLVSSYTIEGLQAALKKGEAPDLLSFGIGADVDPAAFVPLGAEFFKGLKTGAGAGGSASGDYGSVSGSGAKTAFAAPWCMNCYALYTEKGDFANASAENTLIARGGKNLAEAAAGLTFAGESISGGAKESVAAYAAFLNGEKEFLLGTGRDVYRFAARLRAVRAKFLSAYNDLYQQIGVLSARTNREKRAAGAEFIRYLLSEEVQKRLPQIGMFSAYYKVYGAGADSVTGGGVGSGGAGEEIAGALAAQIENEIFVSGGARRYADAFLSAEARIAAAELALNGRTEELEKYLKAK